MVASPKADGWGQRRFILVPPFARGNGNSLIPRRFTPAAETTDRQTGFILDPRTSVRYFNRIQLLDFLFRESPCDAFPGSGR